MDFIGELIDEVIERVVEERWLPIVGYEGLYEVSDLGRVRSLARTTTKGGIMKQQVSSNKYLRVELSKQNIRKKKLIHRLVLEAFLPIEEKMEVDHINHIKTDNRLENLRWATRSENKRNTNKMVNCSSQYIGVSWCKSRNNWEVRCKFDNKNINVGRFNTELEAAKAYNNFIIENNLQEFAILNSI